ncbi:MAG: hypothetical protein ACKO96_41905, partial [Flammeovirgaceae bacterium]
MLNKKIMRLRLLAAFIHLGSVANAQVRTSINSGEVITSNGKFKKSYNTNALYRIPKKDVKALFDKERSESRTDGAKPFRIAEAVPVDINVVKEASWIEEEGYSHGSFTVIADDAKSISVNFDRFRLPK